ncbi:MAG: PEP-CTERM sorting domain-containing protein [Pirellulales bacterium]
MVRLVGTFCNTNIFRTGCCALIVSLISQSVFATPPTPQKMFAVGFGRSGFVTPFDGNPNPGDTVMFYDVTAIDAGGASNVFNNEPLFSVWLGFEIFNGETNDAPDGFPNGNREEISALTFNPANGTAYVAAFDSGSPPAVDQVGDTQGDFDLYKIDYQAILKDFNDNSRPKGTIYGPKTLTITTDDESFLESIGSPLYDGLVDGLANDIPHPEGLSRTVNLTNSITKVGELGRSQAGGLPSFYDVELDFIDPETLVVLDAAKDATPAGDFQIRTWQRISTDPGAAPGTIFFDADQEGGFNGNSTQSWESKIAGRLEMDTAEGFEKESDPAGWGFVNQDGVLGVWVGDSDGGGDDVSFFELDLSDRANPVAIKKELFSSSGGDPFPTGFAVDEDPSLDATTNDGEIDFLQVDSNSNLVIGETGFFDEPRTEPRVITVEIADYDSPDSDASGVNEILPAGPIGTGFNDTAPWTVTGDIPVTGPIDNDGDVTNTTQVAYDKGTGFIYIIDQDTGFTEDIYVFDPATGTIVYSEFGPFNIDLFNTGTQIVFTRGDITGNGVVSAEDIDQLLAAVADPTQGGKFTSAVGQEFYDLTGDSALATADVDELVQDILDTEYGDHDLDGDVDGDDLSDLQASFGTANTSWANGNTDGNSSVDGADFLRWQRNVGFTNAAVVASVTVPEPTSILLVGLGLLCLATRWP